MKRIAIDLFFVRCLVITCLVVSYPLLLTIEVQDQLVIWNVGQGQWVTWVTQTRCEHFDMGGERADWKLLRKLCGARQNKVHFSHWDLDHINLVPKVRSVLRDICIATYPIGLPPQPYKLKMLKKISACENANSLSKSMAKSSPQSLTRQKLTDSASSTKSTPEIKRQFFTSVRARWARLRSFRNRRSARPDTNATSQIYAIQGLALIPGDSTKQQEEIWSDYLSGSGRLKWLILGHHGSQTSTSPALLAKLKHLKIGIASCRQQRYGHPHASVTARLQQQGVSVLTTEDWGAIRLMMPRSSRLPTIQLLKPMIRKQSMRRVRTRI